MKELFYKGKEISTGKEVLVLKDDFDAMPKEKAVQSLLDMGVEVTDKIVIRDVQEEPEIGTAEFLKEHGIKTRILRKLSEGSTEILDAIRSGNVAYVINSRAVLSGVHYVDGAAIRRCAIENNVTIFTSLDTVRVLLDVLEEQTIKVSTIF